MNSKLLAVLAEKNSADLEAIVNKIGVANLIALLPHIVAILETIQGQTPRQ